MLTFLENAISLAHKDLGLLFWLLLLAPLGVGYAKAEWDSRAVGWIAAMVMVIMIATRDGRSREDAFADIVAAGVIALIMMAIGIMIRASLRPIAD